MGNPRAYRVRFGLPPGGPADCPTPGRADADPARQENPPREGAPVAGDVLRIANMSGFYGDRFDAPREMLTGGDVDVLTGDYLAELTMLILWRTRLRKPEAGYASTFLRQMRDCLGIAVDQGVKVVVNAGGLNPAGLADGLRELATELGVEARIAHVEGDDLLPRLGELQAAGHALANLDTGEPLASLANDPLTANAYLGGWGIAAALGRGADVVVTGRVTDASLVVGPAAQHFGWARDDFDALAGAVVAGHVIECGAQATGGNHPFFTEVPGLEHPGFPIAELRADGSCTITKHDGTGGLVDVDTVTAQLLYEIGAPTYLNPDVATDFTTIELAPEGPDRVRVSGVRGTAPPADAKVCINTLGGFRNGMTFVLTGLEVDAKVDLVKRTVAHLVDLEAIDVVDWRLVRSGHVDAPTNAEATSLLHLTVKDRDQEKVGRRAFSSKLVEMALASYPGFTMTAPPADAEPYGVYWPTLVPKDEVHEVVVHHDGERESIAQTPGVRDDDVELAPAQVAVRPETGATQRVPLGTVVGARSGDKGGNANVGLWARDEAGWQWLRGWLDVARFRELLPEADQLDVHRHELANLRALNFVVVGLLDEGVSSSTRPDPQAKGLGEYLRSRLVDVPANLLAR